MWRIDPKRSIDAKAREVHKITEADLIGCPTLEEAGPEIAKRLNDCDMVIAHNGFEFDFPFIAQELERIREPLPDFEPFDTMLAGRWATPLGEVPNLGALSFACGVPYDPDKAHSAEYDVLRMMECFFFGIRRGLYNVKLTHKAG